VRREIPVIADDYVDRSSAPAWSRSRPRTTRTTTGGPAPQAADDLRADADAKINDDAPEKYRGMDRFAARKAIVADLEALGLLVEIKKHKLMVPRCAAPAR
jgi:valyl-tRNA synthetase